jgi:hypothetical protein
MEEAGHCPPFREATRSGPRSGLPLLLLLLFVCARRRRLMVGARAGGLNARCGVSRTARGGFAATRTRDSGRPVTGKRIRAAAGGARRRAQTGTSVSGGPRVFCARPEPQREAGRPSRRAKARAAHDEDAGFFAARGVTGRGQGTRGEGDARR